MASGSIPLNILPPGWTFIALIEPFLNMLIIATVFSAALVPLLCILLLFSTPQVRRQPIFIMNLLAVIAGIFTGAVGLQVCVTNIVSQPGVGFQPKPLLVFLAFILFLPVFIDCILAYRLYIVYPARTTSKLRLIVIFTPGHCFQDPTNFQAFWDHAPFTKIEWILQVFDNCWASGLFLWKVWLGRKKAESAGMVPSRESRHSGGDKLKNLFYLALSSFMFPCMFSIAQIILTFHNHDFFIGAYVNLTNIYVEIIGVLLATIWAAKSHSESTVLQCQRGDVELGEFGVAPPEDEEPIELPKSRAEAL
ncbi:hypothetical protein MSAN_00268000 [Mycena sanguinolenta]|uniref:Uncharacterized protein n=1 Tax=Mycena sanguinolenta TaxID=230812 RepID=A0A8H7DK77_9AGAR|nr:hypothetical protein MSAN_00268000 [Mycena sanguinolenta]